ncbi:MAG: TldD/PmbA family protein [Oscillospiraceae bacterium]|jgi:PmbA protein|nr:TldD/PmbA family protein [Oscillospiraceae bacterium]
MTNKDIAEYSLNTMIKAGVGKAACSVTRRRKDEFSVEANEFTLLRTVFDDTLSLKIIKDGRKGVTVVNKLDKDSIDKAVSDCITLASSAQPDEAEDVAEKLENKDFSQNIGGSDMDKLFARSKEFLQQIKDEYPKIVLEGMTSEFNGIESVYVNSKGVEFTGNNECYSAGAMFSAKDGEKGSSFNGYMSNLTSLDSPFIDMGRGMLRTLLGESVRSLDTRVVDDKFVGKVIVTPACEDMIWGTLIGCFLSDRSLIEGTSRWKDALNTLVADSKLTFRAAPLHDDIIAGERYTADGYESVNTDFIRDGVLNSFALSLYGANKTGKPRALNTAFGNIEVMAGDKSLQDIIKGVDKGILLNRFSGASPSPSGDVSGVAKNSFLIENGAVTDALQETMISFNILDILKDIPAISSERCINGISVLPWCCFDKITISGK